MHQLRHAGHDDLAHVRGDRLLVFFGEISVDGVSHLRIEPQTARARDPRAAARAPGSARTPGIRQLRCSASLPWHVSHVTLSAPPTSGPSARRANGITSRSMNAAISLLRAPAAVRRNRIVVLRRPPAAATMFRARPMMPNTSANTASPRAASPWCGRRIDAAPGPSALRKKSGVERPALVAEQLGRAQLKNERQLRAVTNVRELERRAAAARTNTRTVLVPSEPLPPGLGQADALDVVAARARRPYGSYASRRGGNP